MTEGQQGKQAGPGAVGDAPAAFGEAVLAAAKTLGQAPAADPHVTAAVQLGWVMGSLITPGAQTPLPSGVPIDAATVYKAKAIELPRLLASVGVTVDPGPESVTEKLQTGAPAMTEAGDWESTLVAALLAQDVRLAKAFGVGRQLNVIAYGQPAEPMSAAPVTGMIDALDDLTSALPPHAGRAVANSVRAWQNASPVPAREVLQAQCELWRIVLTGEKLPTQLLEPENYVDAAEALAIKLRAVAIKVLHQYIFVVIAIAIVVVAALILLLFAHGATKAVAGASTILVALGLTWKGVGATAGRLAGQLEAPLWGAELDGAITEAITLGVPSPLTHLRPPTNGDYAQRTKRRPGFDPSNPPTA